jgi:hypothetical protein
MPDGIKSNLEPIEESDLDLERTFESRIGKEEESEVHPVEKEAP